MDEDVLVLATRHPALESALETLAARVGARARVTDPGVVEVRGDLAALLHALTKGQVPEVDAPAGETDGPEEPGARVAPEAGERVVPLVDLLRRAELVATLDALVLRQRQDTTTGVVFCDIASTAGSSHAQVLGIAAARIQGVLRRSDSLAHLGSGCFVAVLADLAADTADEVAARIAASVRACFDEPVATASGLLAVSPLVGALVQPTLAPTPAHEVGDVSEGLSGEEAVGWVPPVSGAALVEAIERSLDRTSGAQA